MYLKDLTLDGFKSFYTRTSLHFEPGITAIVGPNGCGKSNLLDAVRWVLGEQSPTQLRGDEIADVISDGNRRRNPKRSARAVLTFDGIEGEIELDREELSVAREVDREGQGSYFVNGDRARLKDIQEIFRDTGVGQDLYSLIGQGDIRDLVVSNPEERREIVEEAAGIASYRHRRDRSQRRLESTREDFEVIDNQLQEKQGRLNQKKGEAEKARKFRKVQGECRRLEFEGKRRTVLDLADQKQAREKEATERKQELEKAREKLETVRNNREEIRENNRRLEQGISVVEDYREDVNKSLEQAHQERVRKETTLESLGDQLNREQRSLEEERETLREDLWEYGSLGNELHRTRLSSRVSGREVQFLDRREQGLQRRIDELNEELESSRDRTLFDVGEEQQVKHRHQRLKDQCQESEERYQSIKQDLLNTRGEVMSSRSELESIYRRLLDVAERREGMRRRHRVHQRRTKLLEELVNDLSRRENQLQQELQNHREQHETMQKLHGEYRGFYEGVRAVMQKTDSDQFGGVVGVIANLIEVPSRLQQALQVALGDRLQNIVVEQQQDVVPMVDYLKQEDAGRATFLPLDVLQVDFAGEVDRSLFQLDGVVGRASELVEYPERVDRAIQYLLGNVLVVENLDVGLTLQRQGKLEEWPGLLVTLEGDKIEAGGSITGGTVNPKHGQLLSRTEKLEELEEEIDRVQAKLEKTSGTRQQLEQDVREADQRLERISNALRGMEEETRRLQKNRRNKRQKLTMDVQEQRALHMELVELIDGRRKKKLQLKSYKELTRLVENRERRRQERTKDVRDRRDQLEKSQQQIIDRRRKSERQEDRANSRRQELTDQFNRIQSRCRRRESQVLGVIEEIASVNQKRQKMRREIARGQFRINRLKQIQGGWTNLRNELRSLQSEFNQELEKANQQLQDAERTTERSRNELNTVKNQVESIEQRLSEHKRTLAEEYDVEESLEELRQREPGEEIPEDTDKLRQKIRKKRSALQEMRPVNQLADKQAEDLEESVEELRKQREDLETACNQLERLIDRLNRRARQQFREAFEEVQDHFQTYVKDLFQGGEGKLRLSDEPILEAGVKLEVQPPGERLQQMSALSGGEKSMAAIAFLFALFERKTTPFCFLDEVDAALDDQNLSQFVRLLHRFEDKTQFIVITHKKITMQAATQLYGVTMSESGVSEIVGIEMDEAEQFKTAQQT